MFIWDIYYADKNDVNMFFPKSISGVIQSEWYYARLIMRLLNLESAGSPVSMETGGKKRAPGRPQNHTCIYQNCIQSSKKYTKVIDKSISANAMNSSS